ncbi:MAG: hypothetical protein C4527_27985 [Candidatus Omnitrophota bacterium]|nr:MAG: hypothetical protein C4527_27985 [Candidatus Omnitrophota bacterium]
MPHTHSPLHILFLQQEPCIRMYKEARALKNLGLKVTLCFQGTPLNQRYPSMDMSIFEAVIDLNAPREHLRFYESPPALQIFRKIWDISREFDIVHCHNEPDLFATVALSCEPPMVHDTHDFLSFRGNNNKFFEAMASRGSDGRIYVSQVEMDGAIQLYGIDVNRSVLLANYMNRDMVPQTRLRKLSETDGIPHLAAPGGITTSAKSPAFFLPGVQFLVQQGIYVHLYPYKNRDIEPYLNLARQCKFLCIHEQLPHQDFLIELTQYDMGFTPWHIPPEKKDDNKTHGHLSNRLLEMVGVGLPVITTDSRASARFVKEHDVGRVIHSGKELLAAIEDLMRKEKNVTPQNVYMEDHIPQVISLYETILAERK